MKIIIKLLIWIFTIFYSFRYGVSCTEKRVELMAREDLRNVYARSSSGYNDVLRVSYFGKNFSDLTFSDFRENEVIASKYEHLTSGLFVLVLGEGSQIRVMKVKINDVFLNNRGYFELKKEVLQNNNKKNS